MGNKYLWVESYSRHFLHMLLTFTRRPEEGFGIEPHLGKAFLLPDKLLAWLYPCQHTFTQVFVHPLHIARSTEAKAEIVVMEKFMCELIDTCLEFCTRFPYLALRLFSNTAYC